MTDVGPQETGFIKDLVSANNRYTESGAVKEKLPIPPSKHVAIVTCMDARIFPNEAFGLNFGDAHVIRNAGGSASDALRSLVISQQLLNTREIIVVKHTDCGMTHFTEQTALALIFKNTGLAPEKVKEKVPALHTFTGLEQAVKEDVEFLKNEELILKETKISGWIYHVEDGSVKRIV